MECEHLGVTFVGREFFRIYEQVTQDRPPGPLVHFYKAYRACLRARLAIWHTHELEKSHWPKWRDLANAYLRLADRHSQQL
jgi:aminoglycoside phosphotransferase family enzyme